MSNVISLATARAKKETARQARDTREAAHDRIEAELLLTADHFHPGPDGRAAQLTAAGLLHYAPRFAEHGVTLTGQETFRDLQHSKQDILQPYEIADEEELSQNIREGKLKGPELKLALALLDQDAGAIARAATQLIPA